MNRSFKTILASVGAVLAIGFATSASATCVQGCTPTPPAPTTPPAQVMPSMGMTTEGWVNSGAVGVGETNGIGSKITGQVVTRTDELFKLTTDSFLTGNANKDCVVNCSDSQSKLGISGFSTVGAASVGYAENSGGCATGTCGTGANGNGTFSQSRTGTNAMFKASLMQKWVGTPAPVAPAAAPQQ